MNEKIKPKRVVTKIGDVFCIEFEGGFKCYFQYICNDLEQLNSSVIRVFKTHYSLDDNPKIEDILTDDIAFYAHTVLNFGIKLDGWYKVGKSSNIGIEGLDNIYFGTANDTMSIPYTTPDGIKTWKLITVNPLENWRIWKVNQTPMEHISLPIEYIDLIEQGGVHPYNEIRTRIQYGYYKYFNFVYSIIKRHPLPEVDSYTKRVHECETYYYHFRGEYVEQEVIVADDKVIRLTPENPTCGRYRLYARPFGDINWLYKEFITADEFDDVWNSAKSTEI